MTRRPAGGYISGTKPPDQMKKPPASISRRKVAPEEELTAAEGERTGQSDEQQPKGRPPLIRATARPR